MVFILGRFVEHKKIDVMRLNKKLQHAKYYLIFFKFFYLLLKCRLVYQDYSKDYVCISKLYVNVII